MWGWPHELLTNRTGFCLVFQINPSSQNLNLSSHHSLSLWFAGDSEKWNKRAAGIAGPRLAALQRSQNQAEKCSHGWLGMQPTHQAAEHSSGAGSWQRATWVRNSWSSADGLLLLGLCRTVFLPFWSLLSYSWHGISSWPFFWSVIISGCLGVGHSLVLLDPAPGITQILYRAPYVKY